MVAIRSGGFGASNSPHADKLVTAPPPGRPPSSPNWWQERPDRYPTVVPRSGRPGTPRARARPTSSVDMPTGPPRGSIDPCDTSSPAPPATSAGGWPRGCWPRATPCAAWCATPRSCATCRGPAMPRWCAATCSTRTPCGAPASGSTSCTSSCTRLVDRDFAEIDRRAATIVARAARDCGVRRIVYLGGLHPDGPLSAHLESRREVGEILLASGVPTAVLQAAVVIGSGSASFEMLRYLTERLPVMVTPRWVGTRIQPIAIRDVLRYLIAAARLPEGVNRTFDIGGPEVLTYREMMSRYAAVAELPARRVLSVPVLTPRLSSHWVEPRDPRATGHRRPADRLAGARGGLPRAGHPRVRAGPARGAHRLRPGRRARPHQDQYGRRGDALVRRRGHRRRRGPAAQRPAVGGRHACTSTSASARAPRAPRRCGRSSPASAAAGVGTRSRWPGRCAAGWTGWSAASGCAAAGATPTACTPATPSTGGGSSGWTDTDGEHLLRLRAEMKVPGRAWLELTVRAGRGRGLALPPARRLPAPRTGRAPVLVGRRAVPRAGVRRHGPQHHAGRRTGRRRLIRASPSACRG